MTNPKTRTVYEVTYYFGGKPAGFGGFFPTREEADASRLGRTRQLSSRVKRVRIPAEGGAK